MTKPMTKPVTKLARSPKNIPAMKLHSTGSDRPVFDGYIAHPTAWDELYDQLREPHAHCKPLVERLGKLNLLEFLSRRASADMAFVNQGITFSVYSDRRGVEKIFPFDLFPATIIALRAL